jgi:aminotransferase
MTDITDLAWSDDVAFVRHLVEEIGVAAVPGSSFYRTAGTDAVDAGRGRVRFCFCKKDETLAEAERRLEKLKPR